MLSLQERHQKILEMLNSSGEVRVNELSRIFEVSEVCIRNDLSELEAKGMLSRVHGGAVGAYEPYYNMSLAQRTNTNKEEKDKIGAKIAEMIPNNQSVFLNAGTTNLAVMRKLTNKTGITIITNSVVLALEGSKYKNFKIILLGGEVEYEYQFAYGTSTLLQIGDYNVDKFIVSADGIDAEEGISTYYVQEADICKKMIEHSKEVIVAMDYTKIGRTALRNIAKTEDIHYLVTNKNAPKTALEEIKQKGVNIAIV
ncbi:MAG: DeoR/GlpR family DNA-binding transcription regulator [Clostridia bacterium]|nr:DeoR/GlpR family DNA-binding transcription regulator [Clostridia bacterium]